MQPGPIDVARPAALVGAGAAGLRVIWVLVASRPPEGLSDPAIYLAAGASIARGDGYTSLLGSPTAYYPPGYPFFVGAVRWGTELVGLGEDPVLAIGLVQALLGGVAAAALVVAGTCLAPGRRGLRIGVIAGVVLACWPNLVLHTPLVLGETVFLAAFCVLIAALLWIWQPNEDPAAARDRTIAISVLVVAAAACTWLRPQAVIVVLPAAALAALLTHRGWRAALRLALWPTVGIALAVAPWAIRNAVVMDAFVPMSTNTGDNLCIGFHDGAQGRFTLAEACATEGRYVAGPEVEVARDAELRRRAIDWMVEHPARLAPLAGSKLAATFSHDTDAIAAWESYGADAHLADSTRAALRWTADLYYWAVGLAALAGAVLVLASWRTGRGARLDLPGPWLFVLLCGLLGALVPALSFGDERFKVPVVASMALLAALTADAARTRPGRVPADRDRPSESHGVLQ